MNIGTVAHTFCGHRILLVRRCNRPGILYPDAWDSITETWEPVTGESLYECFCRGMREEISLLPKHHKLLGTTRQAGHGFGVAFLTLKEKRRVNIRPSGEGQEFGFFTLDEARGLYLGGAVRNHLEAYPEAFEKMARNVMPKPEELGLNLIAA